jgi:polyphosphate kinase 2 (PPK2 family)
MKINPKDFRVREGAEVKLRKWPTKVASAYKSDQHYQKLLDEHVAQLSSLQQLLYASNSHAVLLIFQAMDAAGKDGAIKHVMSGVVHPPLLRSEGLADAPASDKTLWHDRYRSIANLERHLHLNGTRIVKFYLHLSKDEQRKRFLERIDDPEKNWKISAVDIAERAFWKQYMKAYEECLSATSSDCAPWYVVPADDKRNCRLIVSQIVVDTLEGLKMSYPKTGAERRRELLSIRRRLVR